ncbi:MAG TPA: hypothetical protein VMV69_25000 [Pirellulales bacterium]|nr:hypothetical protein [Pirellulales bacterium]
MLSDIYQFCSTRGFHPKGEAIQIGAWPAQFVPVFSPLTREAMEHIQQSLDRQAAWQKGRKSLSWPEKIRMAEAVRESLLQFRAAKSLKPTKKQC